MLGTYSDDNSPIYSLSKYAFRPFPRSRIFRATIVTVTVIMVLRIHALYGQKRVYLLCLCLIPVIELALTSALLHCRVNGEDDTKPILLLLTICQIFQPRKDSD